MVKQQAGSKAPKGSKQQRKQNSNNNKTDKNDQEKRPKPTTLSGTRSSSSGGSGLDPATQQLILNVFSQAFSERLSSPPDAFASALQRVKQALFERDFARAFGDEALLDVYAARYSPTRALCYADALAGVVAASDPARRQPLHVVAVGGGAPELVSFAACLRRQGGGFDTRTSKADRHDDLSPPAPSSSLLLLDSGPWGAVIDALSAELTMPQQLSKHASANARARNSAFIDPSRMGKVVFKQQDVLSLSEDALATLFSFDGSGLQSGEEQEPSPPLRLVTLFFTLNELFSAGGVGKTTTFLLGVTAAVPVGTLLLVVDSPGSYSETVVGKQSRRYPMHWLLDKVLLSPAAAESQVPGARDEEGGSDGSGAESNESPASVAWEKIETRDSLWFRLPETLKYPIPLEDMRYQMHLYRATLNQQAA